MTTGGSYQVETHPDWLYRRMPNGWMPPKGTPWGMTGSEVYECKIEPNHENATEKLMVYQYTKAIHITP